MSTTTLTRTSIERTIGLTGIVGMVLLFAATIATATNEPELDASTAEAADSSGAWTTLDHARRGRGPHRDDGPAVVPGGPAAAPPPTRGRSACPVDRGDAVRGSHSSSSTRRTRPVRTGPPSSTTRSWRSPTTSTRSASPTSGCRWAPSRSPAAGSSSRPGPCRAGSAGGGVGRRHRPGARADGLGLGGAGWVPYMAFWLWLLTTCVVLVRRPMVRPEPVAETARSS